MTTQAAQHSAWQRLRKAAVGLRVRMMLPLILGIAAALALVAYGQHRLNALVLDDMQRDVVALTRHATQRHRERLTRTDELLRGLSQVPAVRSAGPGCVGILAALRDAIPSYENLGVVDPEGRIVCSALPAPADITAAQRSWFRRAVATGDAALGDFQIGQVTKKPTVNVALPLYDANRRLEGVLFAAIGLRSVSEMLDEVTPDGSSLTVVDANGTMLVRLPDPDKWLGQSIRGTALFEAVQRTPTGSEVLQGIDGERRMYAWATIGDGGHGIASLAVGIPAGDVMASRAQVMGRTLLGLGVVGLLLIAVVWVTSTYRIVWRIRRLTAYSRELQAGRLSTRTPEARMKDELGQLALAMNDLARGTENALRIRDDTLALLDTLLRTAPVGLAFFDTGLRFARVNEQLARINGVPVEAHLGRTVPEVLPHLQDHIVPCLQQVLATGEPALDLTVEDPLSQRHFVSGFYPVTDAQRRPLGIGAVVVDISDQRRAAEHQRRVAQAAGALARSLELERSVEVFAEQLSQTVGVRCHVRVKPPEEGAELEARAGDGPVGEGAESFDVGSKERPLGSVRLAHESGRALREDERALLEEVLSRGAVAIDKAWLYRQAQAAIRQREDFLSVAAHELKSPLTSLLLNVDLLVREMRKQQPSPALSTRLTRLGEGLHRLDRLVGSLLDLSRVRAGRFELTRTDADLAEVVRGIADRFCDIARAAGSHIEVDVPPAVRFEFDAQRLEIAIGNLISNALKYGQGSPVHVRVWKDGAHAAVSVKDSGPGIPAQDQPRIFERFERASSAGNVHGFGFGLYLTRQIVKAHGGTISVCSTVGDGAEFTVRLPLGPDEQPETAESEPDPTPG